MKLNRRSKESLGFVQGYCCAVAEILRQHGEDVVAKDVFRGIGKVNRQDIDDYDYQELVKWGLIAPE